MGQAFREDVTATVSRGRTDEKPAAPPFAIDATPRHRDGGVR
jgi:hypothetical protein